jgi:hypothetical protein
VSGADLSRSSEGSRTDCRRSAPRPSGLGPGIYERVDCGLAPVKSALASLGVCPRSAEVGPDACRAAAPKSWAVRLLMYATKRSRSGVYGSQKKQVVKTLIFSRVPAPRRVPRSWRILSRSSAHSRRHSRRIVPISPSAYAFCQGELGATGLSRMPWLVIGA